jgi:hypothetical protein
MEWERLISDYLDDALAPDEVAELFRWIHAHPDNAARFASAVFIHRRLEHRLSAMRRLQQHAGVAMPDEQASPMSEAMPIYAATAAKPQASPASDAPPAKVRLALASWRVRTVAAAIVLMVGVVAFLAWPRSSPARLLAAENATWGGGAAPRRQGERLPTGVLVLNSGLIKIGFENGTQMLIEGPARFSVTDARAITLNQGALTAIVTPAGRGLSVSTPTARVTDLGTEFGVQASATATRIIVFNGKVSVDRRGAGSTSQQLSAGSAVDVSMSGISHVPFQPLAFKRVMPANTPPLDLIDLLAGGDGTGSASGVGIDAATGRANETKAVTIRRGDQRYLPITGHRTLDGCFIPGGTMPVDSAGHLFTFPITSLFSYGLIWTGPNIPWEGELPIATTLPQDAAAPTSRVLVMHSNNGITLNLDAIRALHAQARINGFRARVGNSYRPAPGSSPSRPLASIHVIVDGIARFESRAFSNFDEPIDVTCALSDDDHFLTLVTADGGDGNACDWVLWTRPELLMQLPSR